MAWLTPGHTDKIAGIGLAVGPAGDLLASASEDETVRLTDVTSRAPIGLPAQLVGQGEFTWAAGTTRGDFLTLGLDGRLLRWTVSQSALIDLACSIRTTVADQATEKLASKLCKTR
jgi:WD40 repeat protein